MHRIGFITDDWDRKKPLKSALLERGFTLLPLPSAMVFQEEFAPPQQLDLLLIDLERCATEGVKLCHALRREPSLRGLPMVLLVTEAHLGHLDLGLGMEDYLTLPVTAQRLAQRLTFLMWKLHRVESTNGCSVGELTIDFERYEVRVGGAPVDVTYKEFELLKFLAMRPGKVCTRELLLDKVWGYDFYGGTRTVDVHIRRLRSKLEIGGATYIETIRHVGYRFINPDAEPRMQRAAPPPHLLIARESAHIAKPHRTEHQARQRQP
jgi:two-component system alkaline phosphatase synthesis response regulator PhoP